MRSRRHRRFPGAWQAVERVSCQSHWQGFRVPTPNSKQRHNSRAKPHPRARATSPLLQLRNPSSRIITLSTHNLSSTILVSTSRMTKMGKSCQLGLAGVVLLAVAATAAPLPALPVFLGAGFTASPHPKGCETGWVWVSAEGWWRRELVPPGGFTDAAHDFGHLHNVSVVPRLRACPCQCRGPARRSSSAGVGGALAQLPCRAHFRSCASPNSCNPQVRSRCPARCSARSAAPSAPSHPQVELQAPSSWASPPCSTRTRARSRPSPSKTPPTRCAASIALARHAAFAALEARSQRPSLPLQNNLTPPSIISNNTFRWSDKCAAALRRRWRRRCRRRSIPHRVARLPSAQVRRDRRRRRYPWPRAWQNHRLPVD
jgi:hypothetical protein